jgi:uncharacterized repeat protein (TIGR03803 family)
VQSKKKSSTLAVLSTVLALNVLMVATGAAGQTETVLYSFDPNGTDGIIPTGNIVFDAKGNLYGTTEGGGAYNAGIVYKLSPQTGGGWTESILHSFGNGTDAQGVSAGLVIDSAGNLWGSSVYGGVYGIGTVFELSPHAGGWVERVLHSFSGTGGDGKYPSEVNLDSSGNIYLTTSQGGAYGFGAAFEFVKSGSAYREKTLYSFNDIGHDGDYPTGGLAFTPSGKIYGTTSQGGLNQAGTFFGLSFGTNGTSKANFFYSFGSYNGDVGAPNLLVYHDSNFYGAGINGYGAIYELQPAAGGQWTESIVHDFSVLVDGESPSGPTFDASGNMYGTTCCGLTYNGGTVWELTPSGSAWTETILYIFTAGTDGDQPNGGVTLDSHGNIYGTTHVGGAYDGGVVFEVTP